MNELDKMESIEETVKTTPAEIPAETEKECVEKTSPALDIAEVADESAKTVDVHRYHSMTKQELLAELKSILEADNMEAHREVTALKQAFFNVKSRESMEALAAFVEAGNQPDAFVPEPDETEAEFKNLHSDFKERRAAYLEAEDSRRRDNLAKKEEILAKMCEIAGDIDNVNVKFQDFQQLQQDFRAIKDVPPSAETEIWKQFQTVGEQFYDHLKMNKELRDLDFKKNLEAKRLLIENAVKLADVPDVVQAFRQLQTLHEEWRALGPVAKELRESVWEEFKEASAVVNRRHQEFFEKRKEEEAANEERKTRLCEEVETIVPAGLNTFSEWRAATDRIIDLQKRWKETGFASRKSNTLLYNRFRKSCDDFFAAKTAYFQQTRDEFNTNLEKKTALCERAEALKETDDIQKATAEIVKLQAEWKKIGSVPRKVSDAVWQRFTTACNYFFDERKRINRERRGAENENLDAKRAIIAKLQELPKDGDRNEVIGRVKELQTEWQQIGFVPFKLKDKVFEEYRKVVDEIYDAYKSRESRQRMSRFQERVSELKGDDRQMRRERDKLVRALEARRGELQTIENNMGFFNVKSSAGSSLVREMENKIARLKTDIREIEEKIVLLDAKEEKND